MHASRTRNVVRTILGLTAIVAAAALVLEFGGAHALAASLPDSALDCDSRDLEATEVVLTLDAPIRKGMNTIWCASFLAAWKTLEEDVAKEPIALQGNPEVATALHKAADPRRDIPAGSLYTAAGWNDEGILDQIMKDFDEMFPGKAEPIFPGIARDSFVAFGYLEANLKFAIPYFDNQEPLVFSLGGRRRAKVNSFGIRLQDRSTRSDLRRQAAILFATQGDRRGLTEFAVELDRTSKPNEIVLALVEPKSTLAETVAFIQDKSDGKDRHLGSNDTLLVPEMAWRISHRFGDLEEERFENTSLRRQSIDVAMQDIQFRLNRSGAQLESEAKAYAASGPMHYVFDRPFMLYMRKRGARTPYLVLWIENAELLTKWRSR
jgi:hypothetical protein